MAFPANPSPGDTYTEENTTWVYAGPLNGWYRQTVNPGNATDYRTGDGYVGSDLTVKGGGTFTGTLGYATGAGGTVTQAGSKASPVTLNASCGTITMNNATLGANTIVTFTLNNDKIAANDLLVLNHLGGGNLGVYAFQARCAAGSATISVRPTVTSSDAVVIGFAVIKSATT